MGTGQADGIRLFDQYSAGEQAAGVVDEIGWDIGTVLNDDPLVYDFDNDLVGGSTFTATLTWFRDVAFIDDGDGMIDAADQFIASALDDLNLSLFFEGNLVGIANSTIDNVEHLHFDLTQTGSYTLVVDRFAGTGTGTNFGLAWSATAVPEPSATALILLLGAGLLRRKRIA